MSCPTVTAQLSWISEEQHRLLAPRPAPPNKQLSICLKAHCWHMWAVFLQVRKQMVLTPAQTLEDKPPGVPACAPHPEGCGCPAPPPPLLAQPSPASLAPGSCNTQAPLPSCLCAPPAPSVLQESARTLLGPGLFLPVVLTQAPGGEGGGLGAPHPAIPTPSRPFSLLVLLDVLVNVLIFAPATGPCAP